MSTSSASAEPEAQSAPALKVLRRADYRPVNYTTKTVNLDFNIKPGTTRVEATLGLVQLYKPEDGETAPRSLVLNRGSTSVQAIVSVAIDGVELTEGGAGAAGYVMDEKTLTLTPPADKMSAFTLKIVTDIKPEANTSLEGLYKSGSAYCTQCEAEGFRHITAFQGG